MKYETWKLPIRNVKQIKESCLELDRKLCIRDKPTVDAKQVLIQVCIKTQRFGILIGRYLSLENVIGSS